MASESDLENDRIPLIEVVCPQCGAKFLVPQCINADIILCPCCCPVKPESCN